MIRKVYEVDPMLCPKCGGRMKVVAFITDFIVVDRIINHLKLAYLPFFARSMNQMQRE